MSIENHEIGSLRVSELLNMKAGYNPRKISEDEYEALRRSLSRWGMVEPVVVNRRTNTVVGGHQRIDAIESLEGGDHEVPVIWVDLSENEEKALNLALNRISGDWEWAGVAKLLEELADDPDDELLRMTGFSPAEIEPLLEGEFKAPEATEHSLVDDDLTHVTLSQDQRESVMEAVEEYRGEERLSIGASLKGICEEWLTRRRSD